MDFSMISALIVLGGLGLLFGVGLAVASRIFHMDKDERIERIEGVLPGINCGACGAPGCGGFAEGIANGQYDVSGCIPGGKEVAQKVAEIMGTEARDVIPEVAIVKCRGHKDNSVDRAIYQGIMDCKAATLIDDGAKGCKYGCLGLGSCVSVCPFDAMYMSENGLPVVIEELCTGCGECVRTCPRGIMGLLPVTQKVFIGCVSKDFGKSVKAVCKVGCIGCGLCSKPNVVEDEMIIMDGKLPVIQYDKIKDPRKDLEMAVNKCPTKSFGVRGEVESEVSIEKDTVEEAVV